MRKYLLPIVIILAVAGMVALGAVLSQQDQGQTGTLRSPDIEATDHAQGNPEAAIKLIEYGDMQCPACASFEPLVKQLLADHGDSIHFAYRHLPLTSIHPNAEEGAWAVEAAARQSKFWEMKEMMFARQSEWATMPDPSPKFMDYARSLGLNEERFTADYHSDEVRQKVASDLLTAQEAGFNSTPTFVLNGGKIPNPSNYEQFLDVLNLQP